ncbi:DUF3152 domain-containing protein [Micromonospora sp. ALFpr18c]|uniref:DUF3152 domain-containing protein n=1 Tax=unclassified Micromonospora TaxID=2617518 RepID=UPI00124B3853|nr:MULTISPECIES: DUF3152 domain-containing protein [unclassified Micromonospora]KAB1932614.1 DUF3152 domain-containing protein [Micromonospora sp. ALFpr18c]MDG4761876.1 DUF3152 domain-containing protein [Micromonospora sp. WMMD710]
MPRSFRRQRRFALFAQLVAVGLAIGAVVSVIAEGPGGRPAADRLAADEIPSVAPLVAAPLPSSVEPSLSPSASPSAPPVLRLPGAVPSAGTGRFGYDDRSGPVLGRAGELRRYRVAVESGSAEDAAGFGAAVETALAGPGSWVDSGQLRLQQVPGSAPRDFTVYLATARTAGRMCVEGGVDIRIDGRPYTSCRAPGQVIINLDRWRLSVPHYVSAGVPLSVYRTYVVNHEVGHQLGHRHEGCPGSGRPAPVMMQQTLFLNGCRVNPWPYLDGRRYAGPPL